VKPIANFIIKLADLLEAEGRALRQSSVSVGLAIALAIGAALVGVGGLGMVAWGIFEALRSATNVIGAAFISGVFLLICAVVLVIVVLKLGRGSSGKGSE
jgi:ABC-type proline/glycine betaine transport system permease subunit